MGKRILAFLIDHIIICFAFALLGMVEMFVKTDFELFWKMYYIFLLVFMSSAVKLATEMNIDICDCYSKWKELSKTQDITKLLVNRINHPIKEMHELFADSLFGMLDIPTLTSDNESTMYKE